MQWIYEANRILIKSESGRIIAEVYFPEVDEGVMDVNHTFVDSSLRGQGIADKLLRAAAESIRKQSKKAETSCSYAQKWFETHPEEQDLLVRRP